MAVSTHYLVIPEAAERPQASDSTYSTAKYLSVPGSTYQYLAVLYSTCHYMTIPEQYLEEPGSGCTHTVLGHTNTVPASTFQYMTIIQYFMIITFET